ncbi:MAG: lytic transglycosylase domain-containing protein [Bacteroidetes bacterium]|nr:lytic transglycosylase domain-containing protein [Bacteroidota bacterium]
MDFLALAQQCAPSVHPQTLAAIVRTESGFNPNSIGINKTNQVLSRQPLTKEEAIALAKRLIEQGRNIDMGLGQVNSANLQTLGLTVEDVFDPCKNLAAAASILTGNYQRAAKQGADAQGTLKMALSAYNTGNFTAGQSNGYVLKVQASSAAIDKPGYVVPKIQSAGATAAATAGAATPMPKPLADASQVQGPVVLTASRHPQGQGGATAQAKPAQGQGPVTDPSLVFGGRPAGGDDEAESALVY